MNLSRRRTQDIAWKAIGAAAAIVLMLGLVPHAPALADEGTPQAGSTATAPAQTPTITPQAAPTVTGLTLTYTGSEQELVTVSGASGTMHWSTTPSPYSWSTTIPTKTAAGSYTVYWYMDEQKVNSIPANEGSGTNLSPEAATENGSSTDPNSVTATINPAATSITLGSTSLSTTYPSSATTSVILSTGVLESSVKVASSDPSKLSASLSGGVLTVTPVQGAGDVAGTYTVTVSGESGSTNYSAPANATLTVTVANKVAASAASTPATGDGTAPIAATILMLTCGCAFALGWSSRRRGKRVD